MSDSPNSRDFDLMEVALESSARVCQSGAALSDLNNPRKRNTLDPLAAEYLHAWRAVVDWRKREGK